ncbi:MAG: FliH/SctL family protein [Phycisphaerales bacterium]
MAVIRQSDALRMAEHAVTLDLGDLHAQGEAIIARARAKAQAVIDDGLAQRQKLIDGAAEAGRRQGHDAGFAKGLAEGKTAGAAEARAACAVQLEQLNKAWGAALAAFEQQRAAMLTEAKQDVLALALLLARRVVKRAIESDPTLVVDQAAAVVAAAARSTRLVLRVHPDDEQMVREALPAIAQGRGGQVELSPDGSLSRGSCVAQTAGGGVVDASIESQLWRIAEVLAGPAQPAAGGDKS